MLCFTQTTDTEGYDEYVEGVEPDETSSLETPIKEVIKSPPLISHGVCMYILAKLTGCVHHVYSGSMAMFWAGVFLLLPTTRATPSPLG